jgi:hypothetical protein
MTQGERLHEAFIAPIFRVLRGDIPEDHWGRFYEIGQTFLVFGLTVLLLYWLTRRFLRWARIGQPAQSMPARVVSTQTTLSHDMKGDRPLSTTVNHYATFALDDGSMKEYAISETLFGQLKKGDSGQLTVKGLRFVRFVKG